MGVICLQSQRKLKEISQGFKRVGAVQANFVENWCKVANFYFEILTFWSIYISNKLQSNRIIEKTKDIETIYFENHLIANKIIDLRENLKKTIKDFSNDGNSKFNAVDSGTHALALISDSEEYDLKKYRNS